MGPGTRLLEARSASGCGLKVTFVWHRDRFAHNIAAIDGERILPLLASEEGTDADPWPPSPPLQTIHIEDRQKGRQVALLVGMAGTSHWSLSVEALPSAEALIFDVACRIKERAGPLGSAYRTMVLPHIDQQGIAATFDNRCRLDLESLDDGAAVSLTRSESGLELLVKSPDISRPTTVRWRYRISRFGIVRDVSGLRADAAH